MKVREDFTITKKAPTRCKLKDQKGRTGWLTQCLKAVGAFSVITNLWMDLFEALVVTGTDGPMVEI